MRAAVIGLACLPLVCLLLLAFPLAGQAEPIPSGDGHQTVTVGGYDLEVFTYKPVNYAGGPLLAVFHGVGRDADAYRDHAKSIADRFGMAVVAPLFDRKHFPQALYQRGGIVNRKTLLPQEQWTGSIALSLIDALRRDEGRPDLDYYLLGHSAGGQFLARLAAFLPSRAKRIVIANPSSWVFPSRDTAFPFGMGGATAALGGDEDLKRYLALPLTVYLGTNDTGDKNRDDGDEAMEQGATRYERGLHFFHAGEKLAQEKGWAFHWRLVEVPGVGHSSRRMFEAPQAKAALFGD